MNSDVTMRPSRLYSRQYRKTLAFLSLLYQFFLSSQCCRQWCRAPSYNCKLLVNSISIISLCIVNKSVRDHAIAEPSSYLCSYWKLCSDTGCRKHLWDNLTSQCGILNWCFLLPRALCNILKGSDKAEALCDKLFFFSNLIPKTTNRCEHIILSGSSRYVLRALKNYHVAEITRYVFILASCLYMIVRKRKLATKMFWRHTFWIRISANSKATVRQSFLLRIECIHCYSRF